MITRPTEHLLAAQWTRIGASFNVSPAPETPDIERLLLDTARLAQQNPRLFIMASTWLASYPDYVAKRRLAVLIREQLEPSFLPVLGFLLESAHANDRHAHVRFQDAMEICHPAQPPGPLLAASRRNPALAALAFRSASPLSRKWGCWFDEFEPKTDALRPVEWIAQHNPRLAIRALTGGDLVATIAADADAGRSHFLSESELARRYGASRASIRAALRKLTLAGLAHQSSRGKSHPITLNPRSP
jgi:hypothetical protein